MPDIEKQNVDDERYSESHRRTSDRLIQGLITSSDSAINEVSARQLLLSAGDKFSNGEIEHAIRLYETAALCPQTESDAKFGILAALVRKDPPLLEKDLEAILQTERARLSESDMNRIQGGLVAVQYAQETDPQEKGKHIKVIIRHLEKVREERGSKETDLYLLGLILKSGDRRRRSTAFSVVYSIMENIAGDNLDCAQPETLTYVGKRPVHIVRASIPFAVFPSEFVIKETDDERCLDDEVLSYLRRPRNMERLRSSRNDVLELPEGVMCLNRRGVDKKFVVSTFVAGSGVNVVSAELEERYVGTQGIRKKRVAYLETIIDLTAALQHVCEDMPELVDARSISEVHVVGDKRIKIHDRTIAMLRAIYEHIPKERFDENDLCDLICLLEREVTQKLHQAPDVLQTTFTDANLANYLRIDPLETPGNGSLRSLIAASRFVRLDLEINQKRNGLLDAQMVIEHESSRMNANEKKYLVYRWAGNMIVRKIVRKGLDKRSIDAYNTIRDFLEIELCPKKGKAYVQSGKVNPFYKAVDHMLEEQGVVGSVTQAGLMPLYNVASVERHMVITRYQSLAIRALQERREKLEVKYSWLIDTVSATELSSEKEKILLIEHQDICDAITHLRDYHERHMHALRNKRLRGNGLSEKAYAILDSYKFFRKI